MPNITTSGSLTAKAFGFTLGGAGKYFFNLINYYLSNSTTIFSNQFKNLLYVIGAANTGGHGVFTLNLLNGALISAKTEAAPSATPNMGGKTEDSNGNIYIGGYNSYTSDNAGLFKFNANAALSSVGLYATGMYAPAIYCSSVKGSTLYSTYYDSDYGGTSNLLIQDTSLTISNRYATSDSWQQISALDASVSGKLLTGGNYFYTYYVNPCCYYPYYVAQPFIQLVNTSSITSNVFNKIIFPRTGTTSNGNFQRMGMDSNGNCYIQSFRPGFTQVLTKYDSSGALQWSREMSLSGSITHFNCPNDSMLLQFDTDNNIYCLMNVQDGTVRYILIAKYKADGTPIWFRKLQQTSPGYVDATGYEINGKKIAISGNQTNLLNNIVFVINLPIDGSLTQSFSLGGFDFTYAAASVTSTAYTISPTTLNSNFTSQSLSTQSTGSASSTTITPVSSVRYL